MTSETKPLAILLMGPPGSGKGTHAAPLSQHMNLPHISTGDLFRENMRSQTALGKKAAEYINRGQLVPDELVFDMLFARVSQEDCKNGYILDGFPRTIPQAKVLDEKLKNTHKVIALYFSLNDETVIERISGRIACKDCGRPYHIKYAPSQRDPLCDFCNGSLYQREDDKEEIVRKRLEVYKTQTSPLIAYYAEDKDRFRQINSGQEKDLVFQDLLEALSLSSLLPAGY